MRCCSRTQPRATLWACMTHFRPGSCHPQKGLGVFCLQDAGVQHCARLRTCNQPHSEVAEGEEHLDIFQAGAACLVQHAGAGGDVGAGAWSQRGSVQEDWVQPMRPARVVARWVHACACVRVILFVCFHEFQCRFQPGYPGSKPVGPPRVAIGCVCIFFCMYVCVAHAAGRWGEGCGACIAAAGCVCVSHVSVHASCVHRNICMHACMCVLLECSYWLHANALMAMFVSAPTHMRMYARACVYVCMGPHMRPYMHHMCMGPHMRPHMRPYMHRLAWVCRRA